VVYYVRNYNNKPPPTFDQPGNFRHTAVTLLRTGTGSEVSKNRKLGMPPHYCWTTVGGFLGFEHEHSPAERFKIVLFHLCTGDGPRGIEGGTSP
jgi:hypothetical protein